MGCWNEIRNTKTLELMLWYQVMFIKKTTMGGILGKAHDSYRQKQEASYTKIIPRQGQDKNYYVCVRFFGLGTP